MQYLVSFLQNYLYLFISIFLLNSVALSGSDKFTPLERHAKPDSEIEQKLLFPPLPPPPLEKNTKRVSNPLHSTLRTLNMQLAFLFLIHPAYALSDHEIWIKYIQAMTTWMNYPSVKDNPSITAEIAKINDLIIENTPNHEQIMGAYVALFNKTHPNTELLNKASAYSESLKLKKNQSEVLKKYGAFTNAYSEELEKHEYFNGGEKDDQLKLITDHCESDSHQKDYDKFKTDYSNFLDYYLVHILSSSGSSSTQLTADSKSQSCLKSATSGPNNTSTNLSQLQFFIPEIIKKFDHSATGRHDADVSKAPKLNTNRVTQAQIAAKDAILKWIKEPEEKEKHYEGAEGIEMIQNRISLIDKIEKINQQIPKKPSDKENLENQKASYSALARQFDLQEVRGDGNCYFTAFLNNVLNQPELKEKLRQKILAYSDGLQLTEEERYYAKYVLNLFDPLNNLNGQSLNDRVKFGLPVIQVLRNMTKHYASSHLDEKIGANDGLGASVLKLQDLITTSHDSIDSFYREVTSLGKDAAGMTPPLLALATEISIKTWIVHDSQPLSSAVHPATPGILAPEVADVNLMLRPGHYDALIPKKFKLSQKLSKKKIDTKSNCKNIFVITAPSDQFNTGDVDYANSIVNKLSEDGCSIIHIKNRNLSEEQILQQIREATITSSSPPIIHLMINADKTQKITTGGTLKPSSLAIFKKTNNAKIVVNCIEYEKSTISGNPNVIRKFNEYFNIADQVVFVTDADRAAAAKKSPDFFEKYDKIIPISSTVDINFKELKPIENRPGNLLYFGIIRKYKGIEDYIIPLAKFLNSKKSDKKVILCGSIPRGDGADPQLLKDVLLAAYPNYSIQIQEKFNSESSLPRKVNALMNLYAYTLKELETSNNLILKFDIPDSKLDDVFNQARYALNFHNKGVSHHFSGVTNTMLAGMKSYGLDTYMTDDSLKTNKNHMGAAKLFIPSSTADKIASEILTDVTKIESSQEEQINIRIAIENFKKENKFTIEDVSNSYKELYLRLNAIKK